MWKKTISFFIVLSLILVTSVAALELSKKEVVLKINGESENIKTSLSTVGELLNERAIKIDKYDYLNLSEDTELADGLNIEYIKAKRVIVKDDDETLELYSTKNNLEEFFKEKNIIINDHDHINYEKSTELEEEMEIIINRSTKVILKVDGSIKEYYTLEKELNNFLEEINVLLGENDYVNRLSEGILKESETIEIVRVTKKLETINEVIPFKVVEKKDQNLEKGKTKTVQEGKDGNVQYVNEITYENGVQTKKEQVSKTVTKNPIEKIIAVGEKVIHQTVNRGSNHSNTQNSVKEFMVKATAYTPYCKGCSGVTATGINIKNNPGIKVISVDPKVIPLGSKVWVEGYGIAIAGDTGGAIKGNKIDILVQTKEEAYYWGIRTVKIKILE